MTRFLAITRTEMFDPAPQPLAAGRDADHGAVCPGADLCRQRAYRHAWRRHADRLSRVDDHAVGLSRAAAGADDCL